MNESLTPLMRQYLELKEKHKDCILMFRLGDFYEMFFDDAKTASRELDLFLTGRDCGLSERAPMCGVPYHAVDGYISRLVEKGYKVAICEQLTDPRLTKGLVERDVIRIITPGTVIEESMLDDKQNCYIASICAVGVNIGLAYADVSTGGFYTTQFTCDETYTELKDELAKLNPREVVVNEYAATILSELKGAYFIEKRSDSDFTNARALRELLKHFNVASLKGFGFEKESGPSIGAAGALLFYLEETQKNALAHIKKLLPYLRSSFLQLDASTRTNLELTRPLRFDGSKKNTLIYLLDRTKTSMGARLLKNRIEQPLTDICQINARLDAVEDIVNSPVLRDKLIAELGGIYDIERLSSKIAYASINPRECEALKNSLSNLPAIYETIKQFHSNEIREIAEKFDCMEDVCMLLTDAIGDEPPIGVKDGGIIRQGYNEEIDRLRDASSNGKEWLAKLEAEERERTGIKTLKIKYNRVFGYYIEVTKSYQHLVPYDYQRRQTLANAERYTTPKLREIEETIVGAEEKCMALEYEIFTGIRQFLLECIRRLQDMSELIARVDVCQSLATAAVMFNYCKPTMNDTGVINIVNGRHPVVESMHMDSFVPNGTLLNGESDRLAIITGPNMAGKSTYMRQVALITLMAHIGSFVPAQSADICVVDRIFTRVGASDNVASGQSTFMVEMSEVSNILNNATSKSLLVLDEIGRGTSTFDGLSIAWAVLEHIADKSKCGAKALFATHYHELSELEGKLDGVKNYRVSVKEVGERVVFLHRIVRGSADKSFGIQVAQIAGLPDSVVYRAKEILKALEERDVGSAATSLAASDQKKALTKIQSEVFGTLMSLNTNKLTPLEALCMLTELSDKIKRDEP